MIDTTTEFGKRALQRLAYDQVAWLTTVGSSMTPQPNPVWFLWSGGTVLVFSKADAVKVRNVQQNPRVALNMETGEGGEDVVVLTGTAVLDSATEAERSEYLAKYAEGIVAINMTAESFARDYATVIRITPTRVRGF